MNAKITTIVAVLVVLAFCSASESDLRCRISVLTFILAPTASAFLRPLGCIGDRSAASGSCFSSHNWKAAQNAHRLTMARSARRWVISDYVTSFRLC